MSLVGYTNAGKSTLLNRLTTADVLVEDRLFSTLDSTVRRCTLPDGRFVLLSDTVGFVRRLPHQLVEAFRSTLEDVRYADLLLHVVDGSDPDPAGQIAAVREVLGEIDALAVRELVVFNKADVADPVAIGRLRRMYPDAVVVSAATGEGIDDLLGRVTDFLNARTSLMHLQIPYDRGDMVAAAHRMGEVVATKHDEMGTLIDVRIPSDQVERFRQFEVA
jgi:GTP-binding protein HflX